MRTKIQNTWEKTCQNFPFLFQGIATSLGIIADIFSSMNEKDYTRFKTNAEIDLVRLGLVSVCADSSEKLHVIVPDSLTFCLPSCSSPKPRGLKKILSLPLIKFIST